MSAGHRFATEDGSQLWVGAGGQSPAAAAPRSRVEVVPSARRNGHPPLLRVALPSAAENRRVVSSPTQAVIAGPEVLERSLDALEPVEEAEASAFAARFAADYLSYDEDAPGLRAEVLRTYLADPAAATLGWSGTGRQRTEIALPGRTLRTDDGLVVVEVTARVIPYQRTGPRFTPPEPPGGLPPLSPSTVGPSCAPAPAAPGWVACRAHWVRIAPPVRRSTTGALVIDIGATPAESTAAGPAHERTGHVDPDDAKDGGAR